MIKDHRGNLMRAVIRMMLATMAIMLLFVVSVILNGCSNTEEPHVLNVAASSKDCNCSIDLILYTQPGNAVDVDVLKLK